MAAYGVRVERSARLILPRHPDAPADGQFLEWCAAEKAAGRPLAIDLFSGAGGLGAGVEAAGWTVIAAVDNDPSALATHRANFRGQAVQVDMSDAAEVRSLIELVRPTGVDLVAGGPPCQPFSRAGRAKIRSLIDDGVREAVDARRGLWRSFIDVTLALRPRAVIMENVPDMAIGDDLAIIREIARLLEQAGYIVDCRLLDAWRYGVPQHRKRFFLQARRDGAVPLWPDQDRVRNTVRDAIEDLPRLGATTGSREMEYGGTPIHHLAQELRGPSASEVIHDHMTRPVRADDREAFALMTPTTLYSELPDHLKRYRSDSFADKYKRVAWDDLSRTITAHIAKDGYWYIHPEEDRTLTVREAARIQTFPDSFRFAGSRSDAFRQIGNAVPPLLGRAVATSAAQGEPGQTNSAPWVEMRKRLGTWARTQRKLHWWRYPGPDMTAAAALVVALLDVHRLSRDEAERVTEPLRGVSGLTAAHVAHIDVANLSATRRQSVRRLRRALTGPGVSEMPAAASLLSASQRTTFSILRGGEDLLINQHVGDVVTLLMDLPSDQAGLRTDVKVALALLVATGSDAALRMCAIRDITVAEARARIKITSTLDEDDSHEAAS